MYVLNQEETALYIQALRKGLEPRLNNSLPSSDRGFAGCIRIGISKKLDTITQVKYFRYMPNMSRHLTLADAPDFLKQTLFEGSLGE